MDRSPAKESTSTLETQIICFNVISDFCQNAFKEPPEGGRVGGHNGRKSLILAPQEIPDISGYQWGFGCQFVKAYIIENPVTNQKIL